MKCAWCGAEFEPTDAEQIYCKPLHAKKARASRKRRREQTEAITTAGKCHTPYKAVFQNEEHAIARGMKPETQKLYRCECGALHAFTFRKP